MKSIIDIIHKIKTSSVFDVIVLWLIVINVICMILDSVSSIHESYNQLFEIVEMISVIIFTIEYAVRIYAGVKTKNFFSNALRPLMIIDLLSILPFYLSWISIDLRILRIFRLLRIIKLTRYSKAFNHLGNVLVSKKDELIMCSIVTVLILLLSSVVMYEVEHDHQPDTFSSIPATLWWGVITMTTIGYGDVYPITPVGKIIASVLAFAGVGVFAMPAGIIASGLSAKIKTATEVNKCPHCGEII